MENLKNKNVIQKLLHNNSVCNICLSTEDLQNFYDIYYVENNHFRSELTLKDILGSTFGYHVIQLLPTSYFCNNCITDILKSYLVVKNIEHNSKILNKNLNAITIQIKQNSKKNHEYYLQIDNVTSLNVPNTVVKSKNNTLQETNCEKITFCELNDLTDDSKSHDKDINMKYECFYCGFGTNDLHLSKYHYNKDHNVNSLFKCKCSKQFKTLDDLVDHKFVEHFETVIYCDDCKVILQDVKKQDHNAAYHLEQYKCNICNKEFIRKHDLSEHVLKIHNVDNHCQHCLKTFSTQLKVKHHRCPYKCIECINDCIHEKYLALYREQHMAKFETFTCAECEFTYRAKIDIIRHANEAHLNHFPHLCEFCKEKFASCADLRIHTYENHKGIIYDLKNSSRLEDPHECDTDYSSEDKNIEQKDLQTNECQYCSKVFCSLNTLIMHLKQHHQNKEDSKGTIYKCSKCKLDFKYRADHLKHILTHPRDSKHICRICNEGFLSKSNYYSHIRKHEIKHDKECHICFKKYTKHTINRHMKNHMKDNRIISKTDREVQKPIMCDVCGTLLSSERSLVKHSEIHKEETECAYCKKLINSVLYTRHVKAHSKTDRKLKKCPELECDYTTKFATCLEGHINRHHLKVRPFQCEICSKRFFSDYTLKGHKLTHIDERPTCYCEKCGKKFISKKALMLHLRIHTGERPYPCDLCELSFLSASRRKQHRLRKHFEPSIECEICNKKLYTQSDLRRHLGDCHGGEPKRKKKQKMREP